jgi:exopolysaccharide biosynthesis protein
MAYGLAVLVRAGLGHFETAVDAVFRHFKKKTVRNTMRIGQIVKGGVVAYFLSCVPVVGMQQNVLAQSNAPQSNAQGTPAKPAKETDPDNKKAGRTEWRIRMPKVEMEDWVPLYTGVDEARGTIDGHYHSVFYAIRVDMQAPGISVVGTPHAGSKATISEATSRFAEERGVQVAVNGGFFAPCCATTPEEKTIRGLQITDGKVISPFSVDPTKKGFDVALIVTKDNKATIGRITPDTELSGIYTAITGNNWLLQSGELNPDFPPVPPSGDMSHLDTAPRTVAGVSKDGRFLYLLVIDGRVREYSMGTTYRESAYVMLTLGAYNAVNFDGGGSTTLVEQDATGKLTVVNRPSDKHERLDANALGIHALPLNEK